MKGTMHKCSQLFKLINSPVKMTLMSPSQESVWLTKSLIECIILCKNISKIRVCTLAGRGQIVNNDVAIWLCCFWLQSGHASKQNIISRRPDTIQFIPAHIDNVKDICQVMWGHKPMTIFWNSLPLKLVDMEIASPLLENKCLKNSLACFFFWEF